MPLDAQRPGLLRVEAQVHLDRRSQVWNLMEGHRAQRRVDRLGAGVNIHRHIGTDTPTHRHADTDTDTHTHKGTDTDTDTDARTHARTNERTNARTRT